MDKHFIIEELFPNFEVIKVQDTMFIGSYSKKLIIWSIEV